MVDDNKVARKLGSGILGQLGYNAFLSSCGEESCEFMISEDGKCIKAILMDLNMPSKDGFEAARAIRGEGFKGPIVVYTNNKESEPRIVEGLEKGFFSHYLLKPAKKKVIQEFLAKVISEFEDDFFDSEERRKKNKVIFSGQRSRGDVDSDYSSSSESEATTTTTTLP